MTPELAKALTVITSAIGVVRSKVEMTYNKAASADAQARLAVAAVARMQSGQHYDVIRAEDSPVVYAIVGDAKLHIPNQVALAAFGGLAAVEVVRPDDPRLTLPDAGKDTPQPEEPPVPQTGG
jgi:hypothetical protein